MANSPGAAAPATTSTPADPMHGAATNGSSLQEVIAERDRLRNELADARDELMRLRCQAELLRQEWFTAKLQEEEYRKYIRKLTGSDPYIAPHQILEAEKNGLTMEQILREIEKGSASGAGGD
jgi:hypothetical protein